MVSALAFVGFQAFNPFATAALLGAMAILGVALLPTVKAKLAASAVLVAVVLAGASALAQGVTYPPVNHCEWWWIFLCL